jgi:hypothetical protein
MSEPSDEGGFKRFTIRAGPGDVAVRPHERGVEFPICTSST